MSTDLMAPEALRATIGTLLAEAMDVAVKNGADSRSMPDEYLALALWLTHQPADPLTAAMTALRAAGGEGTIEIVQAPDKRLLSVLWLSHKPLEPSEPLEPGEPLDPPVSVQKSLLAAAVAELRRGVEKHDFDDQVLLNLEGLVK